MSYIAPAGNAVDFAFDGASYTAPAGGAVNFSFAVAVEGRTLLCSGVVGLGGTAGINHGVSVTTAGTLSIDGVAELAHTQPTPLNCAGTIDIGGAVTICRGATFFGVGNIAVTGGASLVVGTALSITERLKLGGRVSLGAGRILSVTGALRLRGGAAQLRVGRNLSASGAVNVNGKAKLTYLSDYSLACLGRVTIGGVACFGIKRDAPVPSISVFSTRPRTEVFSRDL